MAVYHITTPDGQGYEVTAPEEASQDQILQYAQANHAQPEQIKMKNDALSQIGAGVLAFGQGGMPVFDEAGAGIGAGMEKLGLGGMTGGNVGQPNSSLGDVYDTRLQNIRNTEKAFHEQHPNIDTGLRVASALAATVPSAGLSAARPILAGAGYGAAQGFLGSDGGAGNRVAGGVIGAGLGGASAAAIKSAAPFVLNALAPEKGLVTPIASDLNVIGKKLGMAGVTPEQYAAALRGSQPDDFAGELGGEPLRLHAQAQAKLQGEAMQPAREAMRERLAQAPQRTQGILENSFGPQYNIDDSLGTIAQLRASEGDLYNSVNGSIPRSAIQNVLQTDAGKTALQNAETNIGNRMQVPSLGGDQIPINQAHEIAKALGEQVSRNPLTGAIDKPATAAPIEDLRGSIINQLRSSSPEFDLAQTAAADARGFQDAFSRGRSLAKMAAGEKTDNVIDRITMNESQHPYSVAGMHQGLLDSISQAPLGTGNPAGRIANQALIDKAGEVIGPDKAKQLAQALMQEKQRIDFAQRGLYGSNTAETASAAMPEIPTSPHGALASAAAKIGDLLGGQNKERMAQLLYSTTPEQKNLLANALTNGASYFPQYGNSIGTFPRILLSTAPAYPVQTMGALYNQGSR